MLLLCLGAYIYFRLINQQSPHRVVATQRGSSLRPASLYLISFTIDNCCDSTVSLVCASLLILFGISSYADQVCLDAVRPLSAVGFADSSIRLLRGMVLVESVKVFLLPNGYTITTIWSLGELHTLKSSRADSFATLQVRAGESVNNYEITRFAQLFNDELTLDNLERIQLVNLCRFVGIPPFGTDAFLASRLRAHLARIKVSSSQSISPV